MPDSDGSAKAEASPVASPAASPQSFHPGSSCSLSPDPRPQLRRSLARSQTPCTAPLAPGCSAGSPGPDPTTTPHPAWGLPGGRRTQAGPSASPEAAGRGGVGGDGGARSSLIHMQGTARRGGRQERTKAVPPPAAPCQARPARRPGGPRRRPPCVRFAGRYCTGRTASGRRRPPCDPARPTSSATSGATAPFSMSPGQLRWPRLLEPGWTGLW